MFTSALCRFHQILIDQGMTLTLIGLPNVSCLTPISLGLLVVSGLLSSCSLLPQQGTTSCPTVEVIELPVTEQVCPEPKVVERIVTKTVPAALPPMASTAGKLHLPIVGAVEWARVEPAELWIEARIDTGADTTSIHAEDIQLIEKDGKRYVSFVLIDAVTGSPHPQELKLRRRVLIKQSGGPDQRRYVVRMWVTLGETRSRIDVNLTDRSDFEYPLLIGRNFLTDTLIVDVSRHHTVPVQKQTAND
jgi:hypothetical protein